MMKTSDHDILCKFSSTTLDDKKIPIITASYPEYKELYKEHTTWFKHYFIAIALLLLSCFNVIDEFEVVGVKIKSSIYPFAALTYSIVSIIAYTNFELKMRVYRAVYSNELEKLNPDQRLVALMRFPFSFSGLEYMVPNIILKTHTICGLKQVISHLLLATLALLFYIVIIIITLLSYAAILEIIALEQYGVIRYFVPAVWLIVWCLSTMALRNIKTEYLYEPKNTNIP